MRNRVLDGPEAMETVPCVPAEVQMLVRRLATQTTNEESFCASCTIEDTPHEVLLDVETDGVRCLLVRPQSSRRPHEDPLCPARPQRLQDLLSPREQEIARMIAGGYANKTIAAVLDISAWTVGTYLRRIYAKLNVSTRAAMVARLLDENTLLQTSLHGVHTSRFLR